MAKTDFVAEYAVLDLYKKLYKHKYGTDPVVSRHKAKWAVQTLIEDFSLDTVKETMTYFFKTEKEGHNLTWFFFNFETLYNMMCSQKRDDLLRAERRAETQRLAKEYLNGV